MAGMDPGFRPGCGRGDVVILYVVMLPLGRGSVRASGYRSFPHSRIPGESRDPRSQWTPASAEDAGGVMSSFYTSSCFPSGEEAFEPMDVVGAAAEIGV